MTIEISFPPNFEELKQFFAIDESAEVCFAYGDTLHNPYNLPLRDDLIFHEEVHSRQQKGDPAAWYRKYIDNPQFRIDMEAEAYGEQVAFIRRERGEPAALKALSAFSNYLSGPVYGSAIQPAKALDKIRHLYRENL